MTNPHAGMDHESTIRALVNDGNEFDKVDFKREVDINSGQVVAKLAKLVGAIANTDRPTELSNYGYVILGAERRSIVGGMDALKDDKACAALLRNINAYLTPPVRFDVRAYEEPGAGWFAALVVLPRHPTTGAHLISKAFNNGKLVLEPGQCFVRIGEETKLAQRDDHLRMWRSPSWPQLSLRFRTRNGPEQSLTIEQFLPHHEYGNSDLLSRLARCIKVNFELSNSGEAPADRIEVSIELPEGFEASDKRPKLPKKPSPPRNPWEAPDFNIDFTNIRSIHDPAGGPYIKGTKVSFDLTALNHGQTYGGFDPLYLFLPAGTRHYTFPVTIFSTRPGPPTTEMLSISVHSVTDSQAGLEKHLEMLFSED